MVRCQRQQRPVFRSRLPPDSTLSARFEVTCNNLIAILQRASVQ